MIGHASTIISKNASQEDLRAHLMTVTDDDYNGVNGVDYYSSYNGTPMSRLDASLLACQDNYLSVKNTVDYILEDNFSDGYYVDYRKEVMEIDDKLAVFIAYTTK